MTDIAAGNYHSLAIAYPGKLAVLFGFGHETGCGFPDREHRSRPTLLSIP